MATTSPAAQNVDHFFSSSAARLDRWRELNAKAQAWAADARSGKPGGGRAAVEAALAEVRALEDFFAYPGLRLMKALAERIAATTRSGSGGWCDASAARCCRAAIATTPANGRAADEDGEQRAGPAAVRRQRRRSAPALLRNAVRHAGAGRQLCAGSPRRSAACAASKTR